MPLPKLDELFTRKKRNRFLEALDFPHFLVCALVIGLYVLLLSSGRLDGIENNFLDFFFKQRPRQAAHPAVAVIEIDKESLQAVGPWPWPWSYHAQLIETLRRWKAKQIVLDFQLKEETVPEDAAKLLKVLQEAPDVYFPVSFEEQGAKKFYIHSMPVELEPDKEKKAWIHSVPAAEKFAKGLGHKNVLLDNDGVMRRVIPYISYAGESYFYLPLKAAADFSGENLRSGFDLKLPLDSRGLLLINWLGKWQETFERYSYADIIRSDQAIIKRMPPVISPEKLRGKICIVGLSAPDIADFKASPLESSYPVLGVHANVLSNALSKNFIKPVSKTVNVLCLCLIGFIASVLFALFGNVASLFFGLILGFVWIAASFVLFVREGLWFYSFYPFLLILNLFIFAAIYNQFRSKKEEARLFQLATRDGLTGLYVIRHFRDILNQAVADARERKQPISVILLDLDNFKKINDTYGHPAGDMVLKQTAEVVKKCFRSKRPMNEVDFAARYGGEEFIIMVRNADLKAAGLYVAERIRKAVEEFAFDWEGTRLTVTVSVGVATLHADESIPDVMVRRADEALYRAKKTGKNRVCLETFAGG